MRRIPEVGQINVVLIACYFVPLWGTQSVRALTSSVYGLDDRVHLAASVYYRRLLDLDALPRIASTLAGLKLIMATLFVAYVIDVLRGIVIGRTEDRATLDLALLFAAAGIVIFAVPAHADMNVDLVRLYATQFLLVIGAVVVSMVEHGDPPPAPAQNRASTWLALHEKDLRAVGAATWAPLGSREHRSNDNPRTV